MGNVDPATPPSRLTIRTVIACNIGVCLEGFDFIAYSAFSFIIAKLFFPSTDPLISTLLAFGSLGVAYVVRPFAGLFWGIYADRYGRKLALSWVSIIMAVGTAIIAFAPTYAAVGMAAPIIMLIARLIQGFSASGEFATATAMLVELAPPRKRSFYASTQMASQTVTIALAVGVVLFLSETLTPEALETWGWRLVFGIGTLIGPLGYYMRVRLVESPEFVAVSSKPGGVRKTPLRNAFRNHASSLLCMAGLIIIGSASFYLIIIFLPVYAANELGIASREAQIATIISATIQCGIILLAGRLADKWGRGLVLLIASLIYAAAAYPLFSFLVANPSFEVLLAVQLAAAVVTGFISGPLPAALSGLLPAEVRSTGIGFMYNVVGAIFGGLGPFFITLIVSATGDRAAPAYWAAFTGLTGAAACIYLFRSTRARELQEFAA